MTQVQFTAFVLMILLTLKLLLLPVKTVYGSPRKRGRLRLEVTPNSVARTLSEGRNWKLPVNPRLSHSPPWKMFLWYQLSCGDTPMRPEEL